MTHLPTQDELAIDLEYTLNPALPADLADTERHLNCPDVPLVVVCRKDGAPLRKMAFVGVVQETGWIAVAHPRQWGYSQSLHFIERFRIKKAEPAPPPTGSYPGWNDRDAYYVLDAPRPQ